MAGGRSELLGVSVCCSGLHCGHCSEMENNRLCQVLGLVTNRLSCDTGKIYRLSCDTSCNVTLVVM